MSNKPTALSSLTKSIRSLADWIGRVSLYGTDGYPPDTVQRLRIINIAAFLIVLVTANYIVLYAAADALRNWNLVAANLFLLCVALTVPHLHKIDDHTGFLVLIIAEFIMLFYIISQVGRDAGVQINYIGFAAGAFLGIEHSRVRLTVAIIIVAFLLSIGGWFLFPQPNPNLALPDHLINNIYVNSVLGTVGVVSFVIYYAFSQVRLAKAETDRLLRNILPDKIADRLKAKPEEVIADSCEEASVLFADLVGFTPAARELGPTKVVELLNTIFTRFDACAGDLQIEKIKTIGDAYMAVAGLPEPQSDHAERLACMALKMMDELHQLAEHDGYGVSLRIGIDTGPVMAGVIGRRKFFYDVWGDTVNMASRLESHGVPDKIHVSQAFKDSLDGRFQLEPRGVVDIKGVGEVNTWYLVGVTQNETQTALEPEDQTAADPAGG